MATKALHLLLLHIIALTLSVFTDTAIASRNLPAAAVATSLANPTNSTEQFLSLHNQARAAVGVGPLQWSTNLSTLASRFGRYQRDNKNCSFADLATSPYGANQAWASFVASPVQVVGSWVEVKQYYNHQNNSCAAGHECGTYTQVVWKKTKELGCAQASCGGKRSTTNVMLTICLYFPPGNVAGESPY